MIDIINTQFSLIQTQFGSKIRFIRFDDETTLGGDFKRITDKYGIIVERTPPNTPAQNGTAENAGKMLMVRARALLLLANLPQNLWPEAIKTAGYLENRTPKRALQWKTLFESATGNKPSLAHLYPYGCLAYVLNKQIPRRAKIATLSPEALTKQSTRDVPIPSLPESELSSSPSSSLSQRDIITTTSSYNTAPLAEQIHADIDVSYIIQGSRRSQRKEHHTTAFSSLPQLSSYFAVFAIGRSKLRTPRLHQNDLPPPPRFYHELVQHPYAREFRKACEDEINALKELISVNQALYGFRESPAYWYKDLIYTLTNFGLDPVPGAFCVFTNSWLTILFYIDDIIAICKKADLLRLTLFENTSKSAYTIKSLGDIQFFLGIRVLRDRQNHRLWLCQDNYISKISTRFNIKPNPQACSPLPTTALTKNPAIATPQQVFGYQQRVGSINYAAVVTRADIAKASSILSEFLRNPSATHINAAVHTLQYLENTKFYAIMFDGKKATTTRNFQIWSDASHADDIDTRVSSMGYCLILFGAHTLKYWLFPLLLESLCGGYASLRMLV
ncbi:hypothetical protein SS1G_11109 [Sclerotinia sclerotiorum 1980 UF-70]|uniref:Integrase catalytic domain-containing protein n=1 Tax=Sclerotinia sclerotiorum (strain ATCC 18683 / 1980 / Ss-1) TaxID=665079 RepID=A7F0J1_SCLS1|nr:hypothetical protein SS1G_11109 [Sclerotinia sclerotiorum 1980 UF-70]EDN95233.1 hypothetical protein SS1G_11109 [Sclerotinia sclerotiorum 1980 UF-70]